MKRNEHIYYKELFIIQGNHYLIIGHYLIENK